MKWIDLFDCKESLESWALVTCYGLDTALLLIIPMAAMVLIPLALVGGFTAREYGCKWLQKRRQAKQIPEGN